VELLNQMLRHRAARRIAIALGLAAIVALPAPALAGELPDAEKIMEKSLEALGGREKMKKLSSRVTKGNFSIVDAGIQGPMTTYAKAPNLQYTMINLEGMGKIEQGTNGKVYWELSPMTGPRILEGDERALNERDADFYSDLNWRDHFEKVETVGEESVDGDACYKVVQTPKAGPAQTVFYDKKTYVPRKLAMTVKGPMGEIPFTVTLEEYKTVDGIRIPHKLTQSVGGMQRVLITIESVEHNGKIEGERFELPAPVAELAESKGLTTKQP
jgi:outer membrane lipoprotein-sorting protein